MGTCCTQGMSILLHTYHVLHPVHTVGHSIFTATLYSKDDYESHVIDEETDARISYVLGPSWTRMEACPEPGFLLLHQENLQSAPGWKPCAMSGEDVAGGKLTW